MSVLAFAQTAPNDSVRVTIASTSTRKKIPVGEIAEHAVQQMKLTLPGSQPFHLKAKIFETESRDSDRPNQQSDYKAEVEEYWVAPDRWRRTIVSPDFSQTLVVDGDRVSERDKGDYFPWWLNDLITAIFDPLPMADQLKQVSSGIAEPSGGEHSTSCADFHTKSGRYVFCFEGSHGALASVVANGYEAEFKDYAEFHGKRVAKRIIIDPEPGTTIKAFITEISQLVNPEASSFAVDQSTPQGERIQRLHVSEETLRQLAVNDTVSWPGVGGGPLTGRCAVFVSVDRNGHPREVWPGGCDNPGLQDSLREQVQRWQFKTAAAKGTAVQVEGSISFEFQTKLLAK